MITSKVFGATNLVAFTHSVNVNTITGYWRGAAAAWVHVYDATSLPADAETAIPVFSLRVAATSSFALPQFTSGGFPLTTGCVIAFSSQEAYMAIQTGAGNVGDIFVEVDDYETPYTGTSSATSSNSPLLTVWTEGPKRLVQLTVTVGTDTQAVVPLIFADSDGTLLIKSLTQNRFISGAVNYKINGDETRVFKFGPDGIDISIVSAGTVVNGCYVKLSTSATAYAEPADIAGTSITALYR